MEISVGAMLVISEQDDDLKTYANVDSDILVNNEQDNINGKVINGEITVVRDVVGACLNTSQSIRMKVVIDGEDVSDSLVGNINVAHNLNYISTFSLQLADRKYSPLVDSHIAVNSVVVITVYVNEQEVKLFTGLIDSTKTIYDGGYVLNIQGRDYGKKLLEKTMTLVSIQEAADRNYRGSMVKYLAGKADITDVNIPTGDKVTIDHSFQDQSLWDMIQKECAIEGWNVRFDADGFMQINTRVIKTSTSVYPTADWDYGESKFTQIGLETTDKGIINKVTILGAIFEEETITVNEIDVPPYEPVYDEQTTTLSGNFSLGEAIDGWTDADANFSVKAKYIGHTSQSGLPFNPHQNYQFTITILNNDLTWVSSDWTISGDAFIYWERKSGCRIHRETFLVGEMSFQEGAFGMSVKIKTKEQTDGGKEQYEADNPTEEFISTITYTQVKASVEDANSIALYGERKPNNEGTLEFPLAETNEQCERIGNNIILNSHRFIKQPDFVVNFNPKLVVGETVELTDNGIGYDGDRYFIEEVVHVLSINKKTGVIRPRTRIGCVYYA